MDDPTPGELAGLHPSMQPRALSLINALRNVGVPVIIQHLGGRRTMAEQQALYADPRKVTSTLNSRHLSGMAFDIDVWGMSRDSIPGWFWEIVGPWAEKSLQLRWGGRWRNPYDPGHFEL